MSVIVNLQNRLYSTIFLLLFTCNTGYIRKPHTRLLPFAGEQLKSGIRMYTCGLLYLLKRNFRHQVCKNSTLFVSSRWLLSFKLSNMIVHTPFCHKIMTIFESLIRHIFFCLFSGDCLIWELLMLFVRCAGLMQRWLRVVFFLGGGGTGEITIPLPK